ncbi:hypothetical protein N0V93_003704 [Gnomoniopsis smithogilvyi]|uniref:Glucose-methanol-choline oxidoreductase N-terminal domain-containing protein n=1 Tax=Gnomoniopsis smithogilvyi TaxID=1191159 RepID=A0A9W8YZ77_9PEZI|nr:hypothetical protein N0V93_003704 [Gnomoniopsis smithogilvyi]
MIPPKALAANQTFDYVVVGAGLSGITVANRLSGQGYSTLVIEAGPDARWNPEELALVEARRSMECDLQVEQGAGLDPSVHGFSGVVNVSFPTPMRIPEAVALYKEALPLTFPGLVVSNDISNRSADHTVSASTSWTMWYDALTGHNLRSSAADALLWAPGQQKDTLTILTNHKVDKVIFTDNLTASGVIFGIKPDSEVSGSLSGLYTVKAFKEVILSAGALASASVLERSGIGRPAVLQAAGVQPLLDLPGVGVNLVDQPGTGASALVADQYQNQTEIIDDLGSAIFAPVISLINIDQIWSADASSYYDELTSANNTVARAAALVSSGAAANIEGAVAILNATIDLVANQKCR